jgi:hypothetical protein
MTSHVSMQNFGDLSKRNQRRLVKKPFIPIGEKGTRVLTTAARVYLPFLWAFIVRVYRYTKEAFAHWVVLNIYEQGTPNFFIANIATTRRRVI